MSRNRAPGAHVVLAVASIFAACAPGGWDPGGQATTGTPPAVPAPGPTIPWAPKNLVAKDTAAPPGTAEPSTPGVDVTDGAEMSLALRGTLPPLVAGQTVHRAVVTIEDVQLVGPGMGTVALSTGSITADLLNIQCALQPIAARVPLPAGRFSELRFRIAGAWIQTVDDENVTHVFASGGVDASQFESGTPLEQLRVAGIGSDGYVSASLPRGGLALEGAPSVAVHFALNQSLAFQDDTGWVLTPRSWLVDQSTFSSLGVSYDVADSSASLSNGYQAMMLDSNLLPVCEAPLEETSSDVFHASFADVEAAEGPFVVALVPPPGISLQSSVAVAIDVQENVSVEATVHVNSIEQVSTSIFLIRTARDCDVVQRRSGGEVVARTVEPVGEVDEVAPYTHHVVPGETAPRPRAPVAPPARPVLTRSLR